METDHKLALELVIAGRDGVNCDHDEVPNCAILCPIAYASKACQTQSGDTATLNGKHLAYGTALKVHSLLFCQGSIHNHRPQTIGGNGQHGCSNIITVVAVHHAAHSSVECVHFIQAWSSAIHNRLVMP